MDEQEVCAITGCHNEAKPVICRPHYNQLPDDIRERLHWAVSDGDSMDVIAAVAAAEDALDV